VIEAGGKVTVHDPWVDFYPGVLIDHDIEAVLAVCGCCGHLHRIQRVQEDFTGRDQEGLRLRTHRYH